MPENMVRGVCACGVVRCVCWKKLTTDDSTDDSLDSLVIASKPVPPRGLALCGADGTKISTSRDQKSFC